MAAPNGAGSPRTCVPKLKALPRQRPKLRNPKEKRVGKTSLRPLSFARDPGTGQLEFLNVLRESDGVPGLTSLTHATVSPDNKHVYTTASFHDRVLQHPEFIAAQHDTKFVEREFMS